MRLITYLYTWFSLDHTFMLTWCSGNVRALDASGPGFNFTRGNTFFFFLTFFGSFFPVIFFPNYYCITEFHNNLKYIGGFHSFHSNFLVLVSVFTHLQKMFSIIIKNTENRSVRKSFGLKAVRLTKFNFIDHLLSLNKLCWY